MQHLLKDSDLNKTQIEALIALGKAVKADPKKYSQALAGKSVVTLFEKPSLRTRVTFDIGINTWWIKPDAKPAIEVLKQEQAEPAAGEQ